MTMWRMCIACSIPKARKTHSEYVIRIAFHSNHQMAFHPAVRGYFLPRTVVAWIGRGGTIAWPPRSPDLTPLDFSVCGYVKDKVFVPPLSAILEELRARITEAVATIGADVSHGIWDEIAYIWDIAA